MRGTALALVILLAVPVVHAAAIEDVRFQPPAQVGPGIAVASQWLVVVFSGQSQAEGYVRFLAPVMSEEVTEVKGEGPWLRNKGLPAFGALATVTGIAVLAAVARRRR